MNIAKFLKTAFSKEDLRWLLLCVAKSLEKKDPRTTTSLINKYMLNVHKYDAERTTVWLFMQHFPSFFANGFEWYFATSEVH